MAYYIVRFLTLARNCVATNDCRTDGQRFNVQFIRAFDVASKQHLYHRQSTGCFSLSLDDTHSQIREAQSMGLVFIKSQKGVISAHQETSASKKLVQALTFMCPMAVVPSACVMRALLLRPLCGEPPAAACSEASPEASLPCRHKAQFHHLVLLHASYMLQAASMSCAAAGMLGVACMSVRPVTCIYMQAQSRNTCISDGYSICLKQELDFVWACTVFPHHTVFP